MFKSIFGFMQSQQQNTEDKKSSDAKPKATPYHLGSPHKTLNNYRDRFKSCPLGRWSQTSGTFSGVMDEIWEFNPYHTGRIIEIRLLGEERGEILFQWKEIAGFTIACKVTKWLDEDPEDEIEQSDDYSEWITIRYDFNTTSTDFGDLIALYQVSDDGTLQKGFWHSLLPLMYINNC